MVGADGLVRAVHSPRSSSHSASQEMIWRWWSFSYFEHVRWPVHSWPSSAFVYPKRFTRKAACFSPLSSVRLLCCSAHRRAWSFFFRIPHSSACQAFLSSLAPLNCFLRSHSSCLRCVILTALRFLKYWPLIHPFSTMPKPTIPLPMIMSFLSAPPFMVASRISFTSSLNWHH